MAPPARRRSHPHRRRGPSPRTRTGPAVRRRSPAPSRRPCWQPNIGDRGAAVGLLRRLRRPHRDITLVWADGGYTGSLIDWCRHNFPAPTPSCTPRSRGRNKTPHPSLIPSQTMPDQRKSSDHVRLRYGFSGGGLSGRSVGWEWTPRLRRAGPGRPSAVLSKWKLSTTGGAASSALHPSWSRTSREIASSMREAPSSVEIRRVLTRTAIPCMTAARSSCSRCGS